MAGVSTHTLYPKFNTQGTIVKGQTSWTAYLFLSSLYEQLPPIYLRIITERFGDAAIEDYTAEYRRLYPAPTTQQEIAAPATDTTTPIVDITMPAETSTATTSYAQTAAADASDTWDINSIVETMSLSNKKRLCSGSDSPAKRAKASDNEMLQKVNQQAEIIQAAIEALQKNQDTKIRELQEAIEENRQALAAMQSELRRFMSAVATTLRGIQERLDE